MKRFQVFKVKTSGIDDYMCAGTVLVAAKSEKAIKSDPAKYYLSSYLGNPTAIQKVAGLTATKEGEISTS